MSDPHRGSTPPPAASASNGATDGGGSAQRLRDRVTYYERLGSPRSDTADGAFDQTDHSAATSAAIDVLAFEQRLHAERMQRSRLASPGARIEVRLRSTPQRRTPDDNGDDDGGIQPASPFNVKLRHVEQHHHHDMPPPFDLGPLGDDDGRSGVYESTAERRYDAGELSGAGRVFSYEKVTLRKTVHTEMHETSTDQHSQSTSVRSFTSSHSGNSSSSSSRSTGTGITRHHHHHHPGEQLTADEEMLVGMHATPLPADVCDISPRWQDEAQHVLLSPVHPSPPQPTLRTKFAHNIASGMHSNMATTMSTDNRSVGGTRRRTTITTTTTHGRPDTDSNTASNAATIVTVGHTTPVRVVTYATHSVGGRRFGGGVSGTADNDDNGDNGAYGLMDDASNRYGDGEDDDNIGCGDDGNECGLTVANANAVADGNPASRHKQTGAAGTAAAEPQSDASLDWYQDYISAHSFQAVAAKMSFKRTNSQYDSHIRQIRGLCVCV